jgi:hypothetical protein
MPTWDEKTNLDLMIALSAGVTKDRQDLVVAAMKDKGYDDVHWDKIRYFVLSVFWLLCCFEFCQFCRRLLLRSALNSASVLLVLRSFFNIVNLSPSSSYRTVKPSYHYHLCFSHA